MKLSILFLLKNSKLDYFIKYYILRIARMNNSEIKNLLISTASRVKKRCILF